MSDKTQYWLDALREGDNGSLVWRPDIIAMNDSIEAVKHVYDISMRVLYGNSVGEVALEDRSVRMMMGTVSDDGQIKELKRLY